ncbi:hypothetical protein EB74_15140 [Mycobacterium sp. SWH-M5]|nr:hypothetical protein EB74_15140 [Mycobacterium sp. SWH-M5]
MIRIAAMGAWSVRYYESTAVRGHEHGGGLSEYYTERDTRVPVVLVAGDRQFAEEKMGVRHGDGISQQAVTRWFEEGVAPGGPGVGKPRPGTCGWDVLVAVPKSVSLQAALAKDPEVAGVIMNCIMAATQDALTGYMYQHAGYTRVTNPHDSSKKDLQRLPALPFIAYFHHTARPLADGTCDPHMHIHCLLPGKVMRADGRMVTIDSESMYHEAKAAGMIFQKSMRDRLSAALGIEWGEVDPHTGIAEIKGYSPETIKAWSRRQTALMEWAQENLGEYSRNQFDDERTDGQDQVRKWAKGEREWLDTAQKATRHKKLESMHYDQLRESWQNDPRAEHINPEAFLGAVAAAAAKEGPGGPPSPAQVFELLGTLKNDWTRADMVEATVGLWGPGRGVEIPTVDEIEAYVDELIEAGCFQAVEDAKSWHREGHMRYTDAITLTREAEVLEMCSVRSRHFQITVRRDWFEAKGLRTAAAEAMTRLAMSQRFLNVLEAPAGTGKTTSLKAFRERAESQGKRVVLLSSARKAISEARAKEAASEYYTIAAARKQMAEDRIDWDRNTVVVIDEAAMTGDRDLYEIFKTAAAANSKIILVGDSHQLQPVRAGGGLFRDLSEQLPWTQSFDYVWRQKDAEEKAMTLMIREATTESQIRKAAHWYATHDRLRAGDALSMADQIVRDYFDEVLNERDTLVIADKWETADALNARIQRINTIAWENQLGHELVGVPIARDQQARYGDIIMTRENNFDIETIADPDVAAIGGRPEIVNRSDRWRVLNVNPADGSIEAMRLGDRARAVLPAEYAKTNVVLGYVGTIHAAQGANADVGFAIGDPTTMTKLMAYPALTRGSELNRLYMAVKIAGEDEFHRETSDIDQQQRIYDTNEAQAMFMSVLRRDDREMTALSRAEQALEALAQGQPHENYRSEFGGIDPYIAQLVHTRSQDRQRWVEEEARDQAQREAWERASVIAQQRALEHAAERDRVRSIDDRDDGRAIG